MEGWRTTELPPSASGTPDGPAPTNVWRRRRGFRWAHQGGAREGPSNTVHAMVRAMEAGADGIELDVHRTLDDVLVCSHDGDLQRMTGRPGRIAALTFEQLQTYDAAARWIPDHVDIQPEHLPQGVPYPLAGRAAEDDTLRIPSLERVLQTFRGVPLNIELKGAHCEELLARLLAAHGRADADTIVVSFKFGRTSRFRRFRSGAATAAPGWHVVLWWVLSRFGVAAPAGGHVALQMRSRIGRRWRLIDGRFVATAHRRGLAVHAWTVDDTDEMLELLALGVDGIMTDRPTVLTEATSRP